MEQRPAISYWTRYSRVSKSHPEVGALIGLNFWVMAMAGAFEISLVLVAVCFSTWIVLPWAFYDNLQNRKNAFNSEGKYENSNQINIQIRWLRESQGQLVVAGFFFIVYIFIDILGKYSTTNIYFDPYSLFLRLLIFVFGSVMMLSGLLKAARVVNSISDMDKETVENLIRTVFTPFIWFNIGFLGFQAFGILIYYGNPYSLSSASAIYFTLLLVFTILNYFSIGWCRSVFHLADNWKDSKGIFTALVLIAPYILVEIYLSHYFDIVTVLLHK